ncbi:hypothetical protein CYJ73_15015 [Gordonia terrae]|uniref:DUF732 domain-containing protein n=1 Tax=Gordonia terrae TaxID=2055 RepID=A0A2I1R6M6_9ACTN|nr:hypothetical protein [Gordonia terrae]PKZ64729.1 hypothetical protein CYJ73_15015 [Gordonia terrae]UPW08895.1 hypothetical protein M1C59_23180 [Gordonia terrae]
MIDARRSAGVALIGAVAAVSIMSACATETSGTAVPEVSPIAVTTSETPTTTTTTTTGRTTAPSTASASPRSRVAVPPQSGAATDPDEMTCGTYLSLTDSEQIATVNEFANRHGKELVKSNPNSYLLVRAFCVGDPDTLLKDNLLLQGS